MHRLMDGWRILVASPGYLERRARLAYVLSADFGGHDILPL